MSFAHGSNDGQKGMGLIMLILIGTVPTAYALNRAVPAEYTATFHQQSQAAAQALDKSPSTMSAGRRARRRSPTTSRTSAPTPASPRRSRR